MDHSEVPSDDTTAMHSLMVTPLAKHMDRLLQLSSKSLDQMLIVSDNARLLSPSALSPVAIATTRLHVPSLVDNMSDSNMTTIRKVSPPDGNNTFTKPRMKLSRWNDNDKALARPPCPPRPPIYWPDTTIIAASSSTNTSDTRLHRARVKRSTSDRSIFQRPPPLSMDNNNGPNNNSNNNKETSRWESSPCTERTTTMPTLSPSSRRRRRRRDPEGNSLVLVRQSSDSALVCPVRLPSLTNDSSAGSSAPSIPKRCDSSDSLSSADGVERMTEVTDMQIPYI